MITPQDARATEDAALVGFFESVHRRPGGTGAILNVIRAAKVRAAADATLLSDLVDGTQVRIELSAYALDEGQHAYRLLLRMHEIGFVASRIPIALDPIDGLLARSRAREVGRAYADRVAVYEADLLELVVAASIAKKDSRRKIRANCAALPYDDPTASLLRSMLQDEVRHAEWFDRWLESFERRFSRRAVQRATERLTAVFEDLNTLYYDALGSYLKRPAA